MNEGLEYAQMLEIPVSTVNVVKKKSIFSRKTKIVEDLKDRVVDTVNERVAAEEVEEEPVASFVQTEDVTAKPEKKKGLASKIIIAEAVAACLIAGGIFLTNVFLPDSAINTFVGSLTAVKSTEANYSDFKLTSVVSDLSDARITVTEDGVIHFTDEAAVYPVCDGSVASVTESDGLFTVKIAHTSKFASIITGLDTVYMKEGDTVKANLPFAYSNGNNEVQVSMFDGDTLLNCYTLYGAVPVWNS